MTVSSDYAPHSYKPGSAMAAEAIPFYFLDSAHVIVKHQASGSTTKTLLVEGTDYTIAGDGSSRTGTITAAASWPTADDFLIARVTGLRQEADLLAHESLPSAEVEKELDRRALIEQEHAYIATNTAGRALLVPDGEYAPDFASLAGLSDGDILEFRAGKLAIMDVSGFAGKFFAGDALGKPTPASGTEGADGALRTDLASVPGSSLARYTAVGSDPAVQSVETKLRQNVRTEDYGTGALTTYNYELSKAHRDEIVCDARQSGMISLIDGTNNREALASMDAWSQAKGGKRILMPTGSYPMDGTFEPSGENMFDGSGGSRSQTVIELQSLDAPGWWCKERSIRIKGINFTNSFARTALAATDTNIIDLLFGDIDGGASFISRVELEDIMFTRSAYCSLMATTSWEMGYMQNITGVDGMGFGMIFDDATTLGYAVKRFGQFMTKSARFRFLEYALKGAMIGRVGQVNRGLHNIFETLECLGCCWDRATLTSMGLTTHMVDVYHGNCIFHQPDMEDQQYAATVTVSTGMARTPNTTPAKGFLCASSGGHIIGGHNSSVLVCADIQAPGWSVTDNPYVGVGTYGVSLPYAFQFNTSAPKFRAEGIAQPGTTKLFDCRTEYGKVFYDGYDYQPTSSTVDGPGLRLNRSPVDAVISGGIINTINKNVTPRGEGGLADSLSQILRSAGVFGLPGDQLTLYPGAETITLAHGAVINNPAAVNRDLTRPYSYKYQPTTWYGEA